MNIKFKKVRVLTSDIGNEYVDVVTKIDWLFEFTLDGFVSASHGQTVLDTQDLTDFIPYSDISDADLEIWVKTSDLASEWDNIVEFNTRILEAKKQESLMKVKYVDPEFEHLFSIEHTEATT